MTGRRSQAATAGTVLLALAAGAVGLGLQGLAALVAVAVVQAPVEADLDRYAAPTPSAASADTASTPGPTEAASGLAAPVASSTFADERRHSTSASPYEASELPQAAITVPSAPSLWTVTLVVDGDTLDAERDGVTERVRVIGIDTPEQGQCGFEEAARALTFLALGREVDLTTGARDERDRYGRLLAYVDVVEDSGPLDVGLSLVTDGYAIARYDSRDGYGAHARETAYVAADAASEPRVACAEPAAPPAAEVAAAEEPAEARSGCDPAYPGVCIVPGPPDLDCGDVPHRRFAVLAPDPHRFDGNGDGVGCESG